MVDKRENLDCFDCFNMECVYEGYPGGWSGPPEGPEGFCKYGSQNGYYDYAKTCNDFIGCCGVREDMKNQFIVKNYEWAIEKIKNIVWQRTGIPITRVGFNKYSHKNIAVFHLGYDPKNPGVFTFEPNEKINEDFEIRSILIDETDWLIDLTVGNTLLLIKNEKWVRFNDNYVVFEGDL